MSTTRPASTPASTGLPWWALTLGVLLAVVALFATVRLTTAASQIAALTRDRQAALDDKARVEHDLAATKKQVEELKGTLSLSQSDLKRVQEDAKSAGSQMTQLNDKARGLEGELGKVKGELQAANAEAEKATRRVVQLEGELSRARTDVQAAVADGQKLRQGAAAAEKAKTNADARVASLEREVEGLTQRLLETQKVVDDLRRRQQPMQPQAAPHSQTLDAPIAQ